MKKMLIAIAIMALAVCALGAYGESMGTANDDLSETSDLSGEGATDGAFVYAKFTLTGIGYQVCDDPQTAGDDVPVAGVDFDVWILTEVETYGDHSQVATPFYIENTGGIAIDLGMWVSDAVITETDGDDWSYVTATEPISSATAYTLNKFRLFGAFVEGDLIYTNEAAVDVDVDDDDDHWLPTAGVAWYAFAGKYDPAVDGNQVYPTKTDLTLAAGCSSGGLLDYCQLRLRLVVGEGASDVLYHGAEISLVSRINAGS